MKVISFSKFSILLLNITLGTQETNFSRVFVSPSGYDSITCGSQDHPCRSIAKAAHQVDWGGEIYLNGSGTKMNPYNCSVSDEHPGIYINRSLSIKGFLSPHVFCVEGFHFKKANDERRTWLEFSGIAFWQTSLSFEDCHFVRLLNCSFRDSSSPLRVQIAKITTFRMDVQDFSFFRNNSQCVEVLLLNNSRNRSRIVTVNIKDTQFMRNGFSGGARAHRGGIKIASNEKYSIKSVTAHIKVSCTSVKYKNNLGPFIDLLVPNAVTEEAYEHVELKYNTFMKYSLYSVYMSDAREAHVKFTDFQCVENLSARCISIQSNKADVEIHDSFFYKQNMMKSTGGSLFLEGNISASLKISNSKFISSSAAAGGSLFANSPRGFLKINLTNVIFIYCRARNYGCTIAIGKRPERKRHRYYKGLFPDELDFTLRNVTVEKWNGKSSKCTAIEVFLKGGKVTMDESSFYKRLRTSVGGAFTLMTLGGKTNVTISKSKLIDNASRKRQGISFKIVASNGNAGNVTIINSLIFSSGTKQKALLISPKYRIKLVNTTVKSFLYGFQVLATPPKNSSFPIDIYVNNCRFINNARDLLLTLLDPTSVRVIIKNTIFTSNDTIQKSFAIRLMIAPLKHISSSNAVITLENDTFDSKPSSNFALFFEGRKNVTIRRSRFRNCKYAYPEVKKWNIPGNKSGGGFYETATGAISILTNPDKPLTTGCLLSDSKINAHPVWHYDSHVTFEDTVFENNVGLIAGGVHLSNGFTKFQRCTFQDNFGVQQTGHVYSAYGTGRVDFEDCSFLRTKESMPVFNNSADNKSTFLYSESGGPLNLTNTSMMSLVPERNNFPVLDISSGGYVDIDKESEIHCSEGSKLLLQNATHIVYTEKNKMTCRINVTVLKFSCRPCSPGYYSLQKGISRGLFINSTVECLPCPFGANCIQSNIAAEQNFWGYPTSNHPSSLQFIGCPEHYCQSPSPGSKNYNRCRGNRTGTLCGKCAEGFTETLFSPECKKVAKCDHYWLWIATAIYTIGLVLYLLIKPPILSFFTKHILWYRREESQIEDDLAQIHNHDHGDSGYVKITFYFYQVAEILMDGSAESLLEKIPFAYLVNPAFNFQVRTINGGIGCPFSGLTAVTKELLLSANVLVTITDVFVIYCVHLFINMLRRKEKPTLIQYLAVLVEVLLLGYERLAETSLKLMHCVSIGSREWLFIDGNVQCYQWWQYILLAYIAVFVIPFILVLYYGSWKLYKSSITATEFLAACVFPLPFIFYWLLKGMRRDRRHDSASEKEVNRDVLEVIHGPFCPPSRRNKGTLYWESVLIGRRFVLLACDTFIANDMLRVACMTCACFLMTLHHMVKNPYRDPLANKAETLSLSALTLIAAFNLPKATMLSFGLDLGIDGPNKPYLDTLEWIEVVALASVPALVSLLVTFAFLSQLARFVVFLIKHISRWWQRLTSPSLTDEREPLLQR